MWLRRPGIVLAVLALVAAVPAPGTAAPDTHAAASWPADAVPGVVIVSAASAEAAGQLRAEASDVLGLPVDVTALTGRVSRVAVPAGSEALAAARLRGFAGITAAEPSRVRQAKRVPNDPEYSAQYQHELSDSEAGWDISTGSADVRIAVLDSGINAEHPDLVNQVVAQASAAGGEITERPVGSNNDPCNNGHGTLVAGMLGAEGDNGRDVTGVNWTVSIIDVDIFGADSCDGAADEATIAGVGFAIEQGAHVINLSIGGEEDSCPTGMQTAFDEARAAGIVVVSSAGNEELETPGITNTPPSCNGVISVGAVRSNGERAGYSTTNAYVDLAAPGGDLDNDGLEGGVLTTNIAGRTEATEGTSFASPFVAGVAGLLLSINPDLTPDEVEAALEQTALDAGDPGRDNAYGWGIVRVGAAAELVASGEPIGEPEPDPEFPVGDGGEGTSTLPPSPTSVFRIDAGTGATDPVSQAVAMSQDVFADGAAAYALIARRDDYADALAGSALGYGFGPLLFSSNTGPLAVETADELQRVLPEGGIVYLLGGRAALPETLEGELTDLGYEPVRLAGGSREDTAATVAREALRVVAELGDEPVPYVLLATRGNWPDAVAAGAIASFLGVPILLTAPDTLHPTTAATLDNLAPQRVYVVGGQAAIRDEVAAQAGQAAGGAQVVRLAGPERNATAVAVSREAEELFAEFGDSDVGILVAVNVRRADGYAHVLSASALTGSYAGVFVPVDGEDGSTLTAEAAAFVEQHPIDVAIAGGADIVSTAVEDELVELVGAS